MDFVQKINKLREQIQQVKEEISWLENSPLSKEDFKARVVEWVDAVGLNSQDADNSLKWLRQPDAKVHSSKMLNISARVRASGSEHSTITPIDISLAPQLVWLFGDQVKQALLAKVDSMDYVPGLPLLERPKRREQLLHSLRVLEEKEEALICESEEAQAPVYRRADADPAVVLGYDPLDDIDAEGTRKVYASGQAQPTTAAARQAIGQAVIPLALPR